MGRSQSPDPRLPDPGRPSLPRYLVVTNWSFRVGRSRSPVPVPRSSFKTAKSHGRSPPPAGTVPVWPTGLSDGATGRPSRFRVSNSQGPAPRARQLVVECRATGRPTPTVPHPRPPEPVGENDKGLPDGPPPANWSHLPGDGRPTVPATHDRPSACQPVVSCRGTRPADPVSDLQWPSPRDGPRLTNWSWPGGRPSQSPV